MHLILASGSPRRHELLKQLASDFEIQVSDIEEQLNADLPTLGAQVADLARQKALAIARLQPSTPAVCVLGADTIVCIDDEILGKPRDAADAARMLNQLSGRWHEVITGVAVVQPRADLTPADWPCWLDFEISRVLMHPIQAADCAEYIASGEPMDKAGAYAIQGGAGRFVAEFTGTYENIVGLPLDLTRRLLQQAGYLQLP